MLDFIETKLLYFQVPKGFPYFSVDFGLQGGFAHVIEDEKLFPYYFGRVGSKYYIYYHRQWISFTGL